MGRVIAVVPIRSGSKRFKDKNIFPVSNVPLFAISAEVARASSIFTDVIIASDSMEYLRLAEEYEFSPFLRSPSAANDTASSEEVLLEICDGIGLANDDWIFLVQATCPLQQEAYFQSAFQLMEDNNSVVTYRPLWRFFLDEVANLRRPRSQDMRPKEMETGLFWGTKCGALRLHTNRIVPPYGKVIIEPEHDIDIDEMNDFLRNKKAIEDRVQELFGG